MVGCRVRRSTLFCVSPAAPKHRTPEHATADCFGNSFWDHIQEVLNKWGQIDDEIWAKIICMERNRRVAKAYARASVLTINGSNEGFDGYRLLKYLANSGGSSMRAVVLSSVHSAKRLSMEVDAGVSPG
ncbi:hypothetical protein HPB49_013368 [Dermacentor silvarum]|uniref:Uncharacterized protein n=1 Tax=Dermacentor silvarum TaxID=543639 RepID=A0ACB8CXM1_DERSI|nr:hypothetical protein HPB49_013368 [Dermacentor silvarum]